MIDVITSSAFDDWYRSLDGTDKEKVAHCIDLLEMKGVALDHPYCSAVNGSRHGGGLRELRVQAKGAHSVFCTAWIRSETPLFSAAVTSKARATSASTRA